MSVGLRDESGRDQVMRRRGDRSAVDADRHELAVEPSFVHVRRRFRDVPRYRRAAPNTVSPIAISSIGTGPCGVDTSVPGGRH